jgi:hypothetical protein
MDRQYIKIFGRNIIAIAGIEMVLKGLGYQVKLGTGVASAEELLIA